MIFYDHWSKVPAAEWRWPSFSPQEVACRGTGKVRIDPAAMDRLQALRDRLGAPLILNSAYRSPEHNRAVGGAKGSFHLRAQAFDVSMANHDPEAFEAAARAVGFTGFGFYVRSNFMHVDIGPAREWGKRFPKAARATPRFSPPPTPRPERPSEDRVVRGGALTTTGAVAALGGIAPVLGNLSPVAQTIAVAGGLLLLAGLAYIIRDRLREWAS